MSSPSLTSVAAAAMSDADDSVHGPGSISQGYPASLEREGFLSAAGGGVNAYARLAGETSPQFELKPVVGSLGAAGGAAASGRKLKVSGPDFGDLSGGSGSKAAAAGVMLVGSAKLDADLELGHRVPVTRRRASGSITAEDF
jgi:hypothetical protein